MFSFLILFLELESAIYSFLFLIFHILFSLQVRAYNQFQILRQKTLQMLHEFRDVSQIKCEIVFVCNNDFFFH